MSDSELATMVECQYYLSQNGAVFGPTDILSIARWIGDGRVTPRDWMFNPESGEWIPILEIPGMAACFYNVHNRPMIPPAGIPFEIFKRYYLTRLGRPDDLPDQKIVEKRRSFRLPARKRISFSVEKSGSHTRSKRSESRTINISEGGLAFEWHSPIEPESILEIVVDLSADPVRLTCQVVHSSRKTSDIYMIGVLFQNPSDADREKISHFVRTALLEAAQNSAPGGIDA